MRLLSSLRALALLGAVSGATATPGKEEKTSTSTLTSTTTTATAIATPCVATSASGAFYDLRDDMASAVKDGEKEKAHKGPTEDYLYSKPHDWPYNFTMNVCAPVVKEVKDVVGVDKATWKNISAYYEAEGKVYSLGNLNTTLVPRGSQLVLRYTGGSPCALGKSKDKRQVHSGANYKQYDDETNLQTEKEMEAENEKDKDTAVRRKSAIISFRCNNDPGASAPRLSFIEVDEDECTYVFSIMSQHACAKTEPHKPGSVGPGGLFLIIALVALAVYLGGGLFYQRTVMHARGWRQLPNYSLWAGIWSFIQDLFVILTSSCASLMPSRRGYGRISVSDGGRGRNREDENRLIDQLDEEWDD